MAQGNAQYSSVFAVDSHGPPRIGRPPRSAKVAQTLLFFLVIMALYGMVIEAYFIYRLYHPGPAESTSASKDIEEAVPALNPSKPVAHLTAELPQASGVRIMSWSTDGWTILNEMEYKDGKLVIQKWGYYYVYSKLYIAEERSSFGHYVKVDSDSFGGGKPETLLGSSKYSHNSGKRQVRSNSYLGGVFHLQKGDRLFVEVRNTSQIVQFRPHENYFGAFMI